MINKNVRPMGYPRRPACPVCTGKYPMAGQLARDNGQENDSSTPAMVFPVTQEFADLYSPEAALCRGTLFKALDKPFCY